MSTAIPSNADVVVRLRAALDRRDRRGINWAIGTLLERNAPLGPQWKSLSAIMEHNGEVSAAIIAMRRHIAESGSAASPTEEVALLQRVGRIEEAATLLKLLPVTMPDPATNAYMRGTLATMLGKDAMARRALRQAVAADPGAGQSWLALAMAGDLSADPTSAAGIVAADPSLNHRAMRDDGAYYYALGKAQADRGRHDDAFSSFARGAAIIGRERPFDPIEDAVIANAARAGFDAAWIDAVAATIEVETNRAIIVTGHPRSGTTLVEQILASHSEVVDGAELGFMRIICQDIAGYRAADLDRYVAKGGSPDYLSRLYLHLLDERFGKSGRVVDKTLTASRTLGLVAALLPKAPLIWMRRDPLDCAWSAFRTFFQSSADWSWSLPSIATHFRIEDEMLAHWQRELGTRLLVVDYERLVTNPRELIPEILAHCGLTPEDAVFTPESTQRAVRTASVMQVRAPISPFAIGAATPYRRHLATFIDAYSNGC